MSDPNVPDLSDPDVRRMVEMHHDPDELWSVSGSLLAVNCRTCGHAWPCPTKKALRTFAAGADR